MKIAIASKGRPKFIAKNIVKDFILFVEPQDYNAYNELYDSEIVNIGYNNRGLAFVRNCILDYMGKERFCILDDDISGFFAKDEKGNIISVDFNSIIPYIENLFSIGSVISLAIQGRGWFFNTKEYDINRGKIGNSMFIDGGIIKKYNIRFDENIVQGEDTDFSLTCYKNGISFISVKKYCIKCPPMGTKPNGCSMFRNKDRLIANKEYLENKWGKIFKWKDENFLDYRVNWRLFYERCNSKL